jgi:sterol desaturase/sphingolipid hydroxylase (fatty acid hydroxylase superfamily)
MLINMNWGGYFATITASMLKFLGGPLVGLGLKLHWIETAVCTTIGMMLTVSLVMFLGEFIKRFFINKKPRKRITKTTRLAVKIRKKFGLIGIAALTPLIFTPAGGTVLAVAFRYSKTAILLNMLISAVVWAFIQTLFFYFVKDLIWG